MKDRIKYGSASWVYGEELGQNTAMWWSPDSTKLAFYRFDESKVPDYILQMDQTKLYTKADIEAYPKAGQPNPIADIFIYDVATKKITTSRRPRRQAVRRRRHRPLCLPGDLDEGFRKELLFNRTNRRQNILEFTAADPATGKCRIILREEWPTGWVDNSPDIDLARGREALPLGLGADRLQEFLPL